MSVFYHHLADYYDQLFPLNHASTEFVRSFITCPESLVLDIGSATGQLAIALLERPPANGTVGSVTAMDIDEKMVDHLNNKILLNELQPRLSVVKGGMADINLLFKPRTYHLILCLGNTLVHLQTLHEIQDFFHSVHNLLRSGGVFIFQVVNYTRILTQHIDQLPLIDKPSVSLTREYRYDETNHLIHFLTRMTVKETNEVIKNETVLYPLEYHQLVPIINRIGFDTVTCTGNFNHEPWESNSPALVMALKKH